MYHMVADTGQELLEMADRVGVARRWIQHEGRVTEHFAICLRARRDAISYGAIQINRSQLARHLTVKREEWNKG